MYQLLFLIHGMGAGARAANDPHWSTDVLAGLRASAKTFGHDVDLVEKKPKPGQILVVPLTYHDVFDTLRDAWAQQSPSEAGWLPLLRGLAISDPSLLGKLPQWIHEAGAFFWTHVLDVLLYRYVGEITVPVRENVATQIAQAWHAADLENGGHTPVHFVSHSLGTAVLHDAICTLASDPAFGPGTHEIDTIMTCANVSPVLETTFSPYASVDRPIDAAGPPDGMTNAYLSFRHEIDPIAAVKAFRAEKHGWPSSAYRDEIVAPVKDWNVHAYAHYLNNPVAHLALFERLWPREAWKARRAAAVAAYDADPGNACPTALGAATQALRTLVTSPLPDTPDGLLEVASQTMGIFRTAKAACVAEGGT